MSVGTMVFAAGALCLLIAVCFTIVTAVGGKKERAMLEERMRKKY